MKKTQVILQYWNLCCFPSETPRWNITEAVCIKEKMWRYYLIAINILQNILKLKSLQGWKGEKTKWKNWNVSEPIPLIWILSKFFHRHLKWTKCFHLNSPLFSSWKEFGCKEKFAQKERELHVIMCITAEKETAVALPYFPCSGRTEVLFCSSTNP